MYYCYLRGKQYELLAIRESISKIRSARITPIIEPVRRNPKDLFACLDVISEEEANILLIVNPSKGELASTSFEQEKLIENVLERYEEIGLAILINQRTSLSEIEAIINKYDYEASEYVFIHEGEFQNINQLTECISDYNIQENIFIEGRCSKSYLKKISEVSDSQVLIADEFNMQSANADYHQTPIEFFSDLYTNYGEQNFDGFGDFSIVGDNYSESGGQAKTAAIHITYPHADNDEIVIQHFLSDERISYEEVGILVDEALSKLEVFLKEERPDILDWSESCKKLLNIYTSQKPTNLANIKKLTIAHHFELMHYLSE